MAEATYDYVVVGAGSAGCVLAARLSEDPGTRVLLLEAGGPDKAANIHVPAAFSKLFKGPLDWAYFTEEQRSLGGRRLYWPRGKVLGGCSSVNAMIYMRGHRLDYDGWRNLGNDGWGWADVLPYFKKSENQERGASKYHGTGGPLNVADLRCPSPLTRAFVEACAEVGIPRNDDFNGPAQDGAGPYQVNQKGGKRLSAAAAFLAPARARPNLTVATGALATRVLLEGTRAVGVEYQQGRAVHQARAGEVLLSGGAVNSPQLLLLSGIGPEAHLKQLGIRVAVDLPGVGQNLYDHPCVGIAFACTRPVTLDKADSLWNIFRFLLFRNGPLTSNVGEGGAFVRSDPALPAPDLQLYFAPAYYVEHGFVRPPGHGFSLGACLLRPESRGALALRSRDPAAAPVVQPNYLERETDLRRLTYGIHLIRRVAHAAALAPWRGDEYLPGAAVQTDEEIDRFVRERVETLYHPVGTCKMGTDALAVVDPQLRVRGATGLRVVDASVMPTLIGGNTHAPTVMIAEKAADLIRGRTLPAEDVG
jgi:choline dehydrogenase